MTATSDIAALCAAIDQGDDVAQLPLADALEEQGDDRATGLRPSPEWYAMPGAPERIHGMWGWCLGGGHDPAEYPSWVPSQLFRRIAGRPHIGAYGAQWVLFPSRSAAYLALAAAMVYRTT